jgi:hypothetical protein
MSAKASRSRPPKHEGDVHDVITVAELVERTINEFQG